MRLWVVVVQDEDAGALMPALLDAGLETYAIASTGGFLRRGNVTVLVALPADTDATVEATARALLADYAQTRTETRTAGLSEAVVHELGGLAPLPLEVGVAGAVVFGLRVARWETW
jgi:uncharacterized protein YaaQ